MKKTLLFFTVLFGILLAPGIPCEAAELLYLADEAGILSEKENSSLNNQLKEISVSRNADVIVVTIPALGGSTAAQFANDFFDDTGYGQGDTKDGILFLVSTGDRKWAISTHGYGITAFTDAGQEYIIEQIKSDLSDGDYYEAFTKFAKQCDDFLREAQEGTPYDTGHLPKQPFFHVKTLLLSIVVGLVFALIVVMVMRSKLTSVRHETAAANYVRPGSLILNASSDIFIGSEIHRTERKNEADSGGSSTHTSSSGETHGGSSGSF